MAFGGYPRSLPLSEPLQTSQQSTAARTVFRHHTLHMYKYLIEELGTIAA